MQSFAELVARATTSSNAAGMAPYDYQQRIANDGYPDLIHVPTGAGKTLAAVLPWVWRMRFHPDPAVRAGNPRRLFLVLPTRVLTDQTEGTVRNWLAGLGLDDDILVHVMMGGRLDKVALREWRMDLHRPTIVICTLDMLVSRALLRGYGVPRASYAIDFALVTNGAHIVVDEIQLVPQGTATLRQLAAFQSHYGTAEPVGLTVMSATVDERLLDTVDHPFGRDSATMVGLSPEDRAGALATRLQATRTIRGLPDVTTPKAFATAILERHVPGSLTLVVVNTVDRAVTTYEQLVRTTSDVDVVLVHSQFRPYERAQQMQQVLAVADPAGAGGIVVATQAIEAGVDIDARTLVTEAAPWSSIVQRAGRCNRAGRYADGEATLWWSAPAQPRPYAAEDVDATMSTLMRLADTAVTSDELQRAGSDLPAPDLRLRMLRRRDFDQLFDTTPDLSGSDVDIQPYIRAELDLDVHIAWVPDGWVSMGETGPRQADRPVEPLRCPVGIGKATDWLKRDDVTAWVLVPSADGWLPARGRRLKPQDLVLASAASGGYDVRTGFSPGSREPVPVPLVEGPVGVPEGVSVAEEAGAVSDATGWLSLDVHLRETREQARALLDMLDPVGIDEELRQVVLAAAYLHDVGKAHPDWQQALQKANTTSAPNGAGLWAKSPGRAPLRFKRDTPDGEVGREGFRHELVSVFMLATDGAMDVLDRLGVPRRWHPLVRYLVAAHHGYLRVTARDPRWDGRDGRVVLGCVDHEPIPQLLVDGCELPESVIDLGVFRTGRADAWVDQSMDLLAELGPYRLAYLETVVRMADWRASARLDLPGGAA
ncbi:MAG: type I-G CRISPR-associated helicase/endonuclease Cas3g [Dermatophilaceae bacterium]